jgi:hypothetical protein
MIPMLPDLAAPAAAPAPSLRLPPANGAEDAGGAGGFAELLEAAEWSEDGSAAPSPGAEAGAGLLASSSASAAPEATLPTPGKALPLVGAGLPDARGRDLAVRPGRAAAGEPPVAVPVQTAAPPPATLPVVPPPTPAYRVPDAETAAGDADPDTEQGRESGSLPPAAQVPAQPALVVPAPMPPAAPPLDPPAAAAAGLRVLRHPAAPPAQAEVAALPAPVRLPRARGAASLVEAAAAAVGPGATPASAAPPPAPPAAAPVPPGPAGALPPSALHTQAAPAASLLPAPSAVPLAPNPVAPAPLFDSAAPVAPAPQLERTIAEVGALREALRSVHPEMTMRHAEFGLVAVRIEPASADQWRAVLASRDPGFIPAIQAALAERALAVAGEGAASGNPGAGAGANGASEQRYGTSPGGGQGSSQPYLGQSQGRSEGGSPHPQSQRQPTTTAAVAIRAGEAEAGRGDLRDPGGVFA